MIIFDTFLLSIILQILTIAAYSASFFYLSTPYAISIFALYSTIFPPFTFPVRCLTSTPEIPLTVFEASLTAISAASCQLFSECPISSAERHAADRGQGRLVGRPGESGLLLR